MLKSGAVYEGKYLLGTSIARPLIAKEQVRVAHEFGADAVAHGATGKGNDQVRFELTYMALDPTLKIIAPWKDPQLRADQPRGGRRVRQGPRASPSSRASKKIYSRDRNLWHISHEGAELESTWNEPQDRMLVMSVAGREGPEQGRVRRGRFRGRACPSASTARRWPASQIIAKLNELGGKHGVGQVDLVENRLVGMKSRGVYETPGGTILYEAHKALESICLDRDTLHYKQQVALRYAELVYYGQWYSTAARGPGRLHRQVDPAERHRHRPHQAVQGQLPGRSACKSPFSMYMADLASFTMGAEYDPTDAIGFIRLFGLPAKVNGMIRRQTGARNGRPRKRTRSR